MNISKNKVVAIGYILRTQENGSIVEETPDDRPLEFLFGRGMLLEKFESYLDGLNEGDSFKFHLSPAEGYGEYNPKMVVSIPRNVFENNGVIDEKVIFVGNVLPMQDNRGNHFNGTILEILEESIKMDFNHQMAGKDLYFEGVVKSVREATEEEIEHGHVHHEGHCCGHCHEHEDGHKHGDHEHCEHRDNPNHECCHGTGHCGHHKE
ncbi:MAG: peptidylprolyl isomerase [Bacteroidales bacterium]|nr:peptidylprolyl isomerase [Bacteroidales bacterium]